MKILNSEFDDAPGFRKIDWNFALMILLLNIVGLINLYSATHGIDSTETDRLFISQIVWLIAGWALYFVMTFIDYQVFVRLAYVIYGVNLAALVGVMFFGKIALGAQR
jgi:rod shape determining protein RodA